MSIPIATFLVANHRISEPRAVVVVDLVVVVVVVVDGDGGVDVGVQRSVTTSS